MTYFPRISVVTPTLNQAEFLPVMIESVVNQHYPNFEHIVIDGGSGDGTLDILGRYPHIQWLSDPGIRQSAALNKALRLATGEIVAWINSDDWYAPETFHTVSTSLVDRSVIMGQCQMTDRGARATIIVPNLEHSWFDILKYWIYDSIPTQPSIFFRRSALDEARYPNGDYFDPDLEFVMDYDLWLRIARNHPFDRRLDRVLSYYRIHEGCKTGGDWSPIFREASRVFARHTRLETEHLLSVAVSIASSDNLRLPVFEGLARQSLSDFEVLVTLEGQHFSSSRAQRQLDADLGSLYPSLALRVIPPSKVGTLDGAGDLILHARAPIVIRLPSNSMINESLLLKIAGHFRDDRLACLLPPGWGLNPLGAVNCVRDTGQRTRVALSLLRSLQVTPATFAVRKVACQEVGLDSAEGSASYSFARLAVSMLAKGWNLESSEAFRDASQESNPSEVPKDLTDLTPEEASTALAIMDSMSAEPFCKVRQREGYGIEFPDEFVALARRRAPRTSPHVEDQGK